MKILSFCLLFLILISTKVSGAGNDTTFVSGLLYKDGQAVSIGILNGFIVSMEHLSKSATTRDFFIAPGLIDLQVNGYSGVDFSDPDLSIEMVKKVVYTLWENGVTSFLPTIITNSQSSLENSFSRLSAAFKDEDIALSVAGFHLEGPYISPVQGFRGAHLEKYIREPDWEEFSSLQKIAQNNIRLITVAPEVNGAISFISKCTESGVIVALGHHNASAEIVTRAVNAGAKLSTHLGNGCANLINRHLNPLWPQLAEERLSISIIADGFHLTREEVKCFYKMKGAEKTILVSDAVDLAGLTPGEYIRDGRVVLLTSDVAKYPAENVLFGAACPLLKDVSDMINFTGCSLADAIRMASTNPAKLLGCDKIGEIAVGMRADLILFSIEDSSILIQKTILAGKTVYEKE